MFGGDRFSGKMQFRYYNDQTHDDDGNTIHTLRPKVEVILRNHSESANIDTNPEIRMYGLIDSGADVFFIPRQIADILKLKLEDSTKKTSKGAAHEFSAFRTKMYLEIIYRGRKIPIGEVEVAVPENPAKNEDIKKMVLLGRKGFFDQYEITFNDKSKLVTLRKLQDNPRYGKKK